MSDTANPKTDIQVLKFGGTSVAGLEQWQFIADLCQQRLADGKQLLLVCSAIAGCTDMLESLVTAQQKSDTVSIANVLTQLRLKHQQLAEQLKIDFATLLDETFVRLQGWLNGAEISAAKHAQILATGEYLSTQLGQRWLLSQNLPVSWQAATELLTCPQPDAADWRGFLEADATAQQQCSAALFSTQSPLIITQGFIAASSAGNLCLLGRGGSDVSAILMAASVGASKVEIFSDVPGVFSANPHLCERARLLLELDYAEALEIAASGAGVIHPRAIRCAEDHALCIQLRQTGLQDSAGTSIRAPRQSVLSRQAVKAISIRQNMLALLLENRDQNRKVGFLAEVFAIFSNHGLAIEQVATSETTTTISLHQHENRLNKVLLKQLKEALRPLCKLTVLPPATSITVVGRGIRTRLETILAAMGEFDQSRLLMASVSANDIACTLLVPEADSLVYLLSMHKSLIESAVTEGTVFGPSWSTLKSDSARVSYDPRDAAVFHFSRCEFDQDSGIAVLGYRFDNQPEFVETIHFNTTNKAGAFADANTEKAFVNALHVLHLIAGISYYKAGIPSRLNVDTLADDAELKKFLTHLYKHGLAEFAHRNELDLSAKLNFEFAGSMELSPQYLSSKPEHDLLAMGGGKDSLVAAEMLKSLGRTFTTVAVGSSELIAETAHLTGSAFIRVARKVAPELHYMNAAGAWNGHVPVTAINAAILVCQALLAGFNNVIFANEASASSPNTQTVNGEDVNHQYSKGLDYEQRFQSILKSKVANNPACFSLLRPWRELAIVEKFSHYSQYFNTFSSCNRNFHLQGSRIAGRWCGDCPKCRFATLMLSLWLPRTAVADILGRDMLADNGQTEGFAQLCGFEGHKPFECVGEVEESCVAVLELSQRSDYMDSPVIISLVDYIQPIAASLPSLGNMLLPLNNHLLPADFAGLIEVDKNEA